MIYNMIVVCTSTSTECTIKRTSSSSSSSSSSAELVTLFSIATHSSDGYNTQLHFYL